MSLEKFIERANSVHNNKYDYSKVKYVNYRTPVEIICPEHGYFWQTPYHHMTDNGCSFCKASHLELDVKKLLDDNHIEYEFQKRFDWLGAQSLDFYIPSKNIAIECQGVQHFQPADFFGGEEGLKATQERDEKKLKLCEGKGIKMLYYAYDKYNDNIIVGEDNLLKKVLNE